MQVDIIVECERCVFIGEVGNVLTVQKEAQLRSCIDFLKCVSWVSQMPEGYLNPATLRRTLIEDPVECKRYPRIASWRGKDLKGALCGNVVRRLPSLWDVFCELRHPPNITDPCLG